MSHCPTSCAERAPRRARRFLIALLAPAALLLACGRGGQAGPPGGPPAVPVEVVTLAERPVEQSTEFVGIVKSRRSTTVQPQVEGFITRIEVRSGDRVRPGTVLMRIDAGMQQAAVASLDAQRAAREADLQYAQQQAARMKTLYEAGAASRAEMEQAQTLLSTSEAQLRAVEAQARQQRVALAYHEVSAPTAGVVGDIPVRVGDSVDRSTVLTTIDQNAGLEIYVNVPVPEAPRLKVGLPVHLVGDDGKVLAREALSFVSPSVDEATQTVLAKAALQEAGGFRPRDRAAITQKEERPNALRTFRNDQFVRARIVWTEARGLTVPIVALNRINGQFFAFVAEAGEGGATVARQRAVEPGPVVGNDYVVQSGLKAGEKLIVSGVQKIRDGAPVQVNVHAPAATLPSGAGRKGE